MTVFEFTCRRIGVCLLLWAILSLPSFGQESITQEELDLVRAAEEARIAAIEKVYGSVVAVYGEDRAGGGSGVIFDQQGFALTNHHVVAGAGVSGWAGLADGKLYRWKLIGIDPGGDVALIQLQGKKKFPLAPLGDSDKVRVGDFAMAMGNPFVLAEDQKPTVTLGVVSGIERYQEGSGNNQLVYGDCIQVDSSINPGNSGGPLFNMRGEVIGINGRGSFLERGRVNVGLGYAISINQIKKFIPDLLATKIVQHGTLDALFGNRGGKVICFTLNLDAPIASAGLELGDELLTFEDRPITNANQFTNLITTLPAGWPAKITFRREGEESVRTAWARLLPLPYEANVIEPEKEEEEEGEEKPEEEEGDRERPAEIPIELQPELLLSDPGKIRDEELNARHAAWIQEQWIAGAREDEQTAAAWLLTDEIERGDARGSQTLLLASDGRFRVQWKLGDASEEWGFDGKNFWSAEESGKGEIVSVHHFLREPVPRQAALLAALVHPRHLFLFGKVILEAGDKSLNQPAYRLQVQGEDDTSLFVWLSQFGSAGENVQLLKTGLGFHRNERSPAVTFGDWRTVGGLRIPHHRSFVKGLEERIELRIRTQECRVQESVEDSQFAMPEE